VAHRTVRVGRAAREEIGRERRHAAEQDREKPLVTAIVCASDQLEGPPRIAKDIANEPLRGVPAASVRRPW
jgi:hypothetical protein